MKLLPDKDQLLLTAKKGIRFISRYRLIAIWLLILVLFGYTLIKIRPISNPVIDENRRLEQLFESQQIGINVDEELRDKIDNLVEVNVDESLGDLGTQDPFSP